MECYSYMHIVHVLWQHYKWQASHQFHGVNFFCLLEEVFMFYNPDYYRSSIDSFTYPDSKPRTAGAGWWLSWPLPDLGDALPGSLSAGWPGTTWKSQSSYIDINAAKKTSTNNDNVRATKHEPCAGQVYISFTSLITAFSFSYFISTCTHLYILLLNNYRVFHAIKNFKTCFRNITFIPRVVHNSTS